MMRARKVSGRVARGALIAAALMASASSTALAQQPAPPPVAAQPDGLSESMAAVVNDDLISTYDLAQRMRLLIATSGVQPTEQNLPQFQREALVALVDEHLQMQELRRQAKEQKIDLVADEDEIAAELAEMGKGNNMTGPQFLAALAAQGIDAETLKAQVRANLSWQRWIYGRYGSRLRIGEDQITAVQQRMTAAASRPQYQISEVLLDAGRLGGMEIAIQGASQLVTQMQQGAPFQAVARQFSAAPTAATGGDAGWVGQGDMPAEVEAALEQMRPGQLSKPIPVRDGVYIVYLRDKRTGAGATIVNLKQAAVPLTADATPAQIDAATVLLEKLRPAVTSCANLESAASAIPGVIAGDLGEAEIKDLAPQFREAAETLELNQLSQPIRTSAGLHLVAVCGKRSSGGENIDRDQIENRLRGQQLSMIAKRYMRDLRNQATIETR